MSRPLSAPSSAALFLLRGDLRIQAAGGWVTDTRAALCRCTRSARQPFCDAACDAPEPPGSPGDRTADMY